MKKILIADDEEPVRALVAATLSDEARYQLLEARNGEEALEVARREKPALVLLDIRMPKINGLEVCRQLKSNPETKDMTVIILTALVQESDKEQGRQAGADSYFTKPFSPIALITKVEEALAQNETAGDATPTWDQMGQEQLKLYAQELAELHRKERQLRQEVEARNKELEQRVRELTALNTLFQKHLEEDGNNQTQPPEGP